MPGPPRRKRGLEGLGRVVTGSSPGSRNPRFGCTPKKRGPLQAVPVIARAMVVPLRMPRAPRRTP
jgi:hypothetical protein